MDQGVERGRLRQAHDGFEGEWIAVGVMAVSHATDGMAENLD
jgi:hypothetical protein